MLNIESTEMEKSVYKGKIITVKELTVKLPNGKLGKREVVQHPGAVGILAITNEGKIVLVRQYRKAVEDFLWEIPAGKIEENEDPLVSAKRELKEETGYRAECWKKLATFYTTPGFSNEIMHLFLAENLTKGDTQQDADEYLEVEEKNIDTLQELINNNEIKDAKTLLALFMYIKK